MRKTIGWLLPCTLVACEPDPPPPPVEPPTIDHGVVLTELMADNASAWSDPDATECEEFDDWFELVNLGPGPADLTGWTAADDPTESGWPLPAQILEVGERLLIVADEQEDQGPHHASFKLSRQGESVVLWDADGEVVDQIDFPPLPTDRSWGRVGDDGTTWALQTPSTPGAPNPPPPEDPCLAPPTGFDDHSVGCMTTVDSFDVLSRTRAALETVKFDILSFSDPDARHVRFVDSNVYDLHDEWYIFRMLNGQPVEGEDLYPPWRGSFATIDDIYTWAEAQDLESLFDSQFIKWAGIRLTSPRFYQLALDTDPRVIGVGVLVHAPQVPGRPEAWGFELEYGDNPSHDELVVYFETLAAALPAEIGEDLVWFTRSTAQIRLAETMRDDGLTYADRVLDYAALTVPGEVEVYNPGITAGRVRMIRSGEGGLESSEARDILVLDEVPDELPQAAALITAIPQTPLAHVALLAESRGIPNAYIAGVTADPRWDQWKRVRAWVAMRATPEGVQAAALGPLQIGQWNRLQQSVPPVLTPVDPSLQPLWIDLASTSADTAHSLRPVIGGKSAGMIPLIESGADIPDAPLALTVRPYAEHAATVGLVDDLLALPAFEQPGDPRTRYLLLEGRDAFRARYTLPRDTSFLTTWAAEHPEGSPLGDLVRAGGLRGAFEVAPVDPDTLATLETELRQRFGHLDPAQGLRFRSSSNVEDIEGFNGAGLYRSHTGFLDPTDGATVSEALRRTWASYWGAEAVEERHAAGIAHEDGAMGVLVHPRFDDVYELSNGVITVRRSEVLGVLHREVVFNNQLGDISVTNPPVGDTCTVVLPEVVRLQSSGNGWQIERSQASTETAGAPVLSDGAMTELADALADLSDRWLELDNAGMAEALHRSTVTLDLEYREMSGDWPMRADGGTTADRIVLKQARSLEPSASSLPEEVVRLPFPRDLLARARTVHRTRCATADFELTAVQLHTDPLLTPDMGHASTPFTGSLRITVLRDMPSLSWTAGSTHTWDHPDLDVPTAWTDPGWLIDVHIDDTTPLHLIVESQAMWFLEADGLTLSGAVDACTTEPLFASPDTFLAEILDAIEP